MDTNFTNLLFNYLFVLNILLIFDSDKCNNINWIFRNQEILFVYKTILKGLRKI